MDYVVVAANLFAQIYGIAGTRDSTSIRTVLEKVDVPDFTPTSAARIYLTDQEMEEERTGDAGQIFILLFNFGLALFIFAQFCVFVK